MSDKTLEKCTSKKTKIINDFVELITPHISPTQKERIEQCGDLLMFVADATLEKRKLKAGDFCGNRFCPLCAWRKARRNAFNISTIMKWISEVHQKEFIFLTLTTPNVEPEQLDEEIAKINKALDRMMKRAEVQAMMDGCIRKLEVTYDKQKIITKEMFRDRKQYYQKRGLKVGDDNPNYNTYHPHFHIVIAVNKTYFTDKKYYITQQRWLKLWQEATGDNSITQVHVQKAKNDTLKQVYELAKYSAKDSDYLVNASVFDVFYKALKGKKEFALSGLFKDGMKLLKGKKLSKYMEKDMVEYIYMLLFQWQTSEYKEYVKRELTDEEKKQINFKVVEELDVN